MPMQHDTPGETAQPGGVVRDWHEATSGGPGQDHAGVQVVERDYTAIADKLASVGPLADTLGFTVKNVTYRLERAGRGAGASSNGVMSRRRRRRAGPAIDTDEKLAEAILRFSGTTNGALAVAGLPARSRSGSASSCTTSPRARRRSGSPSPTPRRRRCR